MTISEKVAYLKGLAEGLGLDQEAKETKLFSAIIDTLDEVGKAITDIEENALDLGEEIDAISDDLSEVEDVIFPSDDDDECDDECCDDDCCCDDGYLYSVTCPTCKNEITIDEDVLDLGEIECPNCGETLEFQLDEDEEKEDKEDKED